jgi:predicted GNAT family N-acyltransferase
MSDVLTYEVRRVRGEAEMAAALSLRHDVFCVEQGVPVYEELDGRDGEGIHLVAVSDGDLLATCRLLFVGPTVQFSRLAVRQSARRQGIASALLTYARTLYEAAGYEPRGRIFMEAGIEHIAMEKILS